MCKSLSFCPSCSQCPQRCHRTEYRGKVAKVLAQVGRAGCESTGSLHSEGGLCPTIQNEATSHQVTPNPEWLCKPGKEPVSQRGIASSNRQVGSGKSGQVIPSLLQPVISRPKTQQQMEAYLGPQSVKLISQSQYIQDGNTGDNPVILAKRGVGNLAGLQQRIFSHPHQTSRKYLRFFLNKQADQFTALLVWPQLHWSLQRWSRK